MADYLLFAVLLEGTYPVLFISFADVKETSFIQARKKVIILLDEYDTPMQEVRVCFLREESADGAAD